MAGARLTARPDPERRGGDAAPRAGLHEVELASGRPALIYAPPAVDGPGQSPLVVLLHGAGSDAARGLSLLQDLADRHGILLLAPSSQDSTWDVIRGGFGPDAEALDAALADLFARFAVDPARVALGGFSDGASYALSLGISNGDLFTHLIAFSPGFAAPEEPHGAPRVYISHGVEDRVLPIDRCSRRLVPLLRRAGYEVEYEEFPGGHSVPPEQRLRAAGWLVG